MSVAEDFAKLLEVVNTLEQKYSENSPMHSYIRSYMDTLRDSITCTANDISKSQLLWSNFHIGQESMRGYKVGTTNLNISAYPIKYKQDALRHPGYWCYNTTTNRFYIAINGIVHCGTFLNMIPNDTVYKFNEHSSAKNVDPKSTGLYVPPELNSASRDIRNLPYSLEYVPAGETTSKKHIIRMGSMRNLQSDISNMDPRDYRIFSDMTMNYLLDLTVAARERPTVFNS